MGREKREIEIDGERGERDIKSQRYGEEEPDVVPHYHSAFFVSL